MMPAFVTRMLRRKSPPRELDVRSGYALWAATYPPRAHTPLMEMEEGAVLGLLPPCAGQRVLDLACGSGRYLRLLMPQRPRIAVGLDASKEMLGRAQETGARLIRGGMLTLPFADRSFDVIVSGLAVGHAPDLQGFLREVARVARRGGLVVYSDLHPDGARAGWVRTFQTKDGSDYVIPHYVHSKSDHESACDSVGLEIESMIEPEVDPPHAWQGRPAALIVRARRRR
jgi:ubiquinone/menaquinone biosynthesis C-methylase UbiE